MEIKNVCPLCNCPVSETKHNKLHEFSNNSEFDNGSLIFEPEMKNINNRIDHINQRIHNKRALSKNHMNNFPAAHLTFVEDQLVLLSDYQQTAHEAVALNNR